MKPTRAVAVFAAAALSLSLAACAAGAASDPSEEADETTGAEAPLYDQLPEEFRDAGEIVIAGDTHPPYRTIEEDGKITGIDPDIQAALSEQLGVPFTIETASGLDAMLTGMLSGRYDAFNGPLRTTAEREAEFDAVVWMTTRTSYVYLEERAKEFSDSGDVCGVRVAGVTGSVTESQVGRLNEWCAAEGREPAEFVGFEDTNSTFLAVNSDRADVAGTTQTAAIDLQKSDPGRYGFVVQTDEQGAGIDQLALFMPKGSGLAEPMLAAFEGIFENGRYAEIMEEWGIADVAVEEPVLNPFTSK
ncbi:transporter substrate-binding domain-containing protein [Agromyces sp. NPDC049794]|uniref:transporter substrate-binding domain-containing protein n=1 Tax=unclassified Agromyces TaxID=2639701 RepID=UPI0033D4BBC3